MHEVTSNTSLLAVRSSDSVGNDNDVSSDQSNYNPGQVDLGSIIQSSVEKKDNADFKAAKTIFLAKLGDLGFHTIRAGLNSLAAYNAYHPSDPQDPHSEALKGSAVTVATTSWMQVLLDGFDTYYAYRNMKDNDPSNLNRGEAHKLGADSIGRKVYEGHEGGTAEEIGKSSAISNGVRMLLTAATDIPTLISSVNGGGSNNVTSLMGVSLGISLMEKATNKTNEASMTYRTAIRTEYTEKLKDKAVELKNENDDLRNKNSELIVDKNYLENKNNELTGYKNNLINENNKLTDDKDNLTGDKNNLINKNNQLEKQISNLNKQNANRYRERYYSS